MTNLTAAHVDGRRVRRDRKRREAEESSDDLPARQRLIKCRFQGVEHTGLYRVEGRFLVLVYTYGTCRVTRGLMDERHLAMRLLRNLLERDHRATARRQT